MTTLFTEVELMRYVYGESTESEKTEIECAAVVDAELQEELFNLEFAKGLLDRLSFDPADLALNNIFKFSSDFKPD